MYNLINQYEHLLLNNNNDTNNNINTTQKLQNIEKMIQERSNILLNQKQINFINKAHKLDNNNFREKIISTFRK